MLALLKLVLLLASFIGHVAVHGEQCFENTCNDAAALLQGAFGIQSAVVPALAPVSRKTLALGEVAASVGSVSTEQVGIKKPLSAGWFGDFAEGESTYTSAALGSSKAYPAIKAQYGYDPGVKGSLFGENLNVRSDFFHESRSGGPNAAWQTNYPALKAGMAGSLHKDENPWSEESTGWIQHYSSGVDKDSPGASSAAWFDSSINQLDGYGRQKRPGLEDGEYYSAIGYKERSVNTTLACKDPGCTARASLQLFDINKEEGRLCKLSVHVHPTDYDDDWDREHVEFVKINGYLAKKECMPKSKGCKPAMEMSLFPCLDSYLIDKLIDSKGSIILEGKNALMVDECPHKGNLLSGVAVATCMVRPKVIESKKPAKTGGTWVRKGLLKCNTVGCQAEALLNIDQAMARRGGKCTMNMSVYQTDFDDANGVPEQIDFIQVNGVNITTAPVRPGKNPCNYLLLKGTNLTDAEKTFLAVTNHDVTKLAHNVTGALHIKAKISDRVDECGHQGNLLYGDVTVTCSEVR